MSVIPLAEVKASLRYTQSSDDAMLQRHLDASEGEAIRFLNRTQLPTLPQDYPPLHDADGLPLPEVTATNVNVAPEVYSAVCLLTQAKVDEASPDDVMKLRRCAENLLMPFRVGMGA